MKRFIVLLMGIVLTLSLAACGGSKLPTQTTETQATDGANQETTSTGGGELAESLTINISNGNNQRTITYNQATPLTYPDGTVYNQGDLKPVWKYIQDKLGIELKDVAIQDQTSKEMMDLNAATNFEDAVVYGGSIGEDVMSYGAQGYFVDLSKRLDAMPNVKAYFEANPDAAEAATAYDGGMYHLPYVHPIGYYSRMFIGRDQWVMGLLDSADALVDETETLQVAYEGYWDRNATNVVDLQNAAASGGKLTREVALQVLLDYIKATYPDLAKPSDLYLGVGAKYDIDELVALWRVVKLSPNTLSKLTTGNVVDGAVISPFFVRAAGNREDIIRLANYFGGQRAFGTDSYGSKWYLDANGELEYSYDDEGMLEAYDYMKQLYSEGLIHSEFSDKTNKDDFRSAMFGMDQNEGQKQFGFMIYEWVASTTAANPTVVAMLPPVTTLGGSSEFVHFVENTRVIKAEGWAISAASTEEEINAALKLFDYMYTEEGNVVQNYGIPGNLEESETFEGPDGTQYPKFNQWFMDSALELKNNDISAFLRDFIGAILPIGYQASIGYEYQNTVNRGWESWDIYLGAGVITPNYQAEDPLLKLIPPIFSLTEQDKAKLATTSIDETTVDQIFLYITGADTAVKSKEDILKLYTDSGVATFEQVYQEAYKRMVQ
ncbi:MAG: hypothetical protein K0R92_1774 [Lachnospiraceae bacterium]|jgi:hypothetical protein|nr:hypothetical protein [Lachnospiraceae bacterium]